MNFSDNPRISSPCEPKGELKSILSIATVKKGKKQIFRHSRAANSVVISQIWLKFELI